LAAEPKPVVLPRRAPADELGQWLRRLKAVQAKVNGLESQILECRTAIIDPSADETSDKEVLLHSGTLQRRVDPYPAVGRRVSGGGGFIWPPCGRASRKPAGQRTKKRRRLLYEERFPDYVPPPERRRDQLRWRMRQQLEYSDPRYHQ
jgi:hypothetical protein